MAVLLIPFLSVLWIQTQLALICELKTSDRQMPTAFWWFSKTNNATLFNTVLDLVPTAVILALIVT